MKEKRKRREEEEIQEKIKEEQREEKKGCNIQSLMTKLNEDSKERTNCIQPDSRANTTPDPVQPDSRVKAPIDFIQPETRATSPTPSTQTEQYYAVDIYVNFSHQISKTLERIQYILNETKIQKYCAVDYL